MPSRLRKKRVQAKLVPLKSPLPKRLEWLKEKEKILIDPSLIPENLAAILDTLSLVTDSVLVADPTIENLSKWRYNSHRFSQLVDKRIFIPLFADSGIHSFSTAIERKHLLSDKDFLPEYDRAIEHDSEDDDFCSLSQSLEIDPEDAAFSANWDLIMAQLLSCPIFSAGKLRNLWEYKFRTGIADLTTIARMPEVPANVHLLTRFVHKALECLPSNLTVEEIDQFRKNRASKNFRFWFKEQLQSALDGRGTNKESLDYRVYREFTSLSRQYAGRSKKISGTLSAMSTIAAGAIGAMIGGVDGATLGSSISLAGPYAFPRILSRVWQKTSRRNWVFVFMELRSANRP